MKAEKFRRHFGFTTEGAHPDCVRYLDVHDYLHTVVGAKPEWGGDEERVVAYEDAILAGLKPVPRGLSIVK